MQTVQQRAGAGPHNPPEPMRRRINNFLSHWVSRLRIALLIILAAAAAALVGYFVYVEISHSRAAASALQAERLQEQFDNWKAETDATKKGALEKDLLDGLNAVIGRYPRQYGGERGLFLRAQVNYEKKAWDASLADYSALAARFPKSYLAPISLFDAAICSEEKGDADTALKLYLQVSSGYKDSAAAPRATFDVGRLYESKSDWTNAQKTYQSMDDAYPQSLWTRLAKNRLIELKVLGKIK
ncbi:MAG TPA: tetratricopeptide repeat protein [Spirochaetia bacterium]|nr:tetratricopeptide repeat protein [Spirochaetia bacterium]